MYVIAGKFIKVRRQCLFLLLVINLCIIFITITLWKIYKPIITNFLFMIIILVIYLELANRIF